MSYNPEHDTIVVNPTAIADTLVFSADQFSYMDKSALSGDSLILTPYSSQILRAVAPALNDTVTVPLANTGFETITNDSLFTGWTKDATGIATLTDAGVGDAHNGTHAAKLYRASGQALAIRQAVGVLYGRKYSISFWAKSDKEEAAEVSWYGASSKYDWGLTSSYAEYTWANIVANGVYVQFFLLRPTCTLYLDDVRVYEVTP